MLDLIPITVMVDDCESCKIVVEELISENEIAVDMEGIELGRTGSICVIQICGQNTPVYIFDIFKLGSKIFDEGKLRVLFESRYLKKVMFDVRGDTDALFYQFNVKTERAYDIQVLYHLRFGKSTDRFLAGLKKVMDAAKVIPEEGRNKFAEIKAAGIKLFAPESGGAYSQWTERPLSKELINYACCDVKYLLSMKQKWGGIKWDYLVESIAMQRIAETISNIPVKGKQKAYRDFDLHFGYK